MSHPRRFTARTRIPGVISHNCSHHPPEQFRVFPPKGTQMDNTQKACSQEKIIRRMLIHFTCSGSATSSGLYSSERSSPSTSGCTQQRIDGMNILPDPPPACECTSKSLPTDSRKTVPQRGSVLSRFLMRPSVCKHHHTEYISYCHDMFLHESSPKLCC